MTQPQVLAQVEAFASPIANKTPKIRDCRRRTAATCAKTNGPQAEVDELWQKLLAGGEESQCGWLTDKHGVSWQIVPTVLGRLMQDPDPEKAGRVTEAMLKMKKLDIAKLQQAYDQT